MWKHKFYNYVNIKFWKAEYKGLLKWIKIICWSFLCDDTKCLYDKRKNYVEEKQIYKLARHNICEYCETKNETNIEGNKLKHWNDCFKMNGKCKNSYCKGPISLVVGMAASEWWLSRLINKAEIH